MTPVVFTLERLAPPARALLRAVQSAAGRSRSPMLVGGAVRDTHRESARRAGPADLDIAVESGALELAARVAARLGGAFVPLDPAFPQERMAYILDDAQVSRHHCQLKLQHGAYSLADLGSRNGSWVNGQQVSEVALGPGDMIRIGGTEIEFQVRG